MGASTESGRPSTGPLHFRCTSRDLFGVPGDVSRGARRPGPRRAGLHGRHRRAGPPSLWSIRADLCSGPLMAVLMAVARLADTPGDRPTGAGEASLRPSSRRASGKGRTVQAEVSAQHRLRRRNSAGPQRQKLIGPGGDLPPGRQEDLAPPRVDFAGRTARVVRHQGDRGLSLDPTTPFFRDDHLQRSMYWTPLC